MIQYGMEKYILDTNIFFNMEAHIGLGLTTEEVVKNLTNLINKMKTKKLALFFMSPRNVEEFLSFFEDKKQTFIQDFLSLITVKSPDKGKMVLSSSLFYELVDDIRQRSYKGLSIGEEEIKKAAILMMGKGNLTKKDFEIQIGTVIKKFRERYRNATRAGFLDSVADLDCILLAKEQEACLVTTDEGLLSWGRLFGVKEILVEVWKKQMNDLLSGHRQEQEKIKNQ